MKKQFSLRTPMLIMITIFTAIFIIGEWYFRSYSDLLGYSSRETFMFFLMWTFIDIILPLAVVLFGFLSKKKLCIIMLAARCLLLTVMVVINNIMAGYFYFECKATIVVGIATIVTLLLFAFDVLSFKLGIIITFLLQAILFVVTGNAVEVASAISRLFEYNVVANILNLLYVFASPLLYVCTLGVFESNSSAIACMMGESCLHE